MSSSFGTIYRIHTFGESHGPSVGVVIDGCPAGIGLDTDNIRKQLHRRRPGQTRLSSQRKEPDDFSILSGVYEGKTLGTPITIIVHNFDVRSKDYESWGHIYRPSHADYSYDAKYAYRTPQGGGRASVRESIGRVIAGAIAGQILKEELGIETLAWVDAVGDVEAGLLKNPPTDAKVIEDSIVRCPDNKIAEKMITLIDKVRKEGDSVGGIVGIVVRNVPSGLGEPVFHKLEAELARSFLSIPACKGFEVGSGFSGTRMFGSEHNDIFYMPEKQNEDKKGDRSFSQVPVVKTHTNYSGGIQGGISNGMPILARAAFKPTATIFQKQKSITESGQEEELQAKGRHDPCVLPRAVPIIEAMTNLVLLDAYLLQRGKHPQWWVNVIDKRKN